MNYEITLLFTHADMTIPMPAVPRIGERVEFDDPDLGDTNWTVADVSYTVYADETATGIYVSLNPADDDTKERAKKFKAEHSEKIRQITTTQ